MEEERKENSAEFAVNVFKVIIWSEVSFMSASFLGLSSVSLLIDYCRQNPMVQPSISAIVIFACIVGLIVGGLEKFRVMRKYRNSRAALARPAVVKSAAEICGIIAALWFATTIICLLMAERYSLEMPAFVIVDLIFLSVQLAFYRVMKTAREYHRSLR